MNEAVDPTAEQPFKSSLDVDALTAGTQEDAEPAPVPQETGDDYYLDLAASDPRVVANAAEINRLRAAGKDKSANALVPAHRQLRETIALELKQRDGALKSPEQLEAERVEQIRLIRAELSEDASDEE